MPLARTAYLNAFVPSAAGSSEYSRGLPQTVGTFGPAALGGSAAAGAAAGGGAAGAAAAAGGRVNGSSPSPSPGPDGMMEGVAAAAAVPDALRKAMRPVIKSLFKRYTVCSMANVRQWLQSQGGAQGNEASQMDDQLLHVLLLGSGYVQTLRRVYVAKEGPHSEAQGLRQVCVRNRERETERAKRRERERGGGRESEEKALVEAAAELDRRRSMEAPAAVRWRAVVTTACCTACTCVIIAVLLLSLLSYLLTPTS